MPLVLGVGVVGITVTAIYETPCASCPSALGEENRMGVEQT